VENSTEELDKKVAECILCGSSENELVKVEHGYRAMRCCACNLIYTHPRPSLPELREMYELGQAASLELEAQIRLSRKKVKVARQDVSDILRLVNCGRLLEVGCGAGYFLCVAQEQGFICTGVEINGVLVEYATKNLGLDVVQGTLLTIDVPLQNFDVIYFRYVLSHMNNPIAEFERMRAALTNKGILFFETGNLPEVNLRSIQKMDLGLPDHLFFFSQRNVKTLLERTGFELLSSKAYSLIAHEALRRVFEKRVRQIVAGGDGFSQQGQSNWKEALFANISELLTYKLGRVLPKRGRFCTIKYIARKK
jgi:SAM-dependent methyltransferase